MKKEIFDWRYWSSFDRTWYMCLAHYIVVKMINRKTNYVFVVFFLNPLFLLIHVTLKMFDPFASSPIIQNMHFVSIYIIIVIILKLMFSWLNSMVRYLMQLYWLNDDICIRSHFLHMLEMKICKQLNHLLCIYPLKSNSLCLEEQYLVYN